MIETDSISAMLKTSPSPIFKNRKWGGQSSGVSGFDDPFFQDEIGVLGFFTAGQNCIGFARALVKSKTLNEYEIGKLRFVLLRTGKSENPFASLLHLIIFAASITAKISLSSAPSSSR